MWERQADMVVGVCAYNMNFTLQTQTVISLIQTILLWNHIIRVLQNAFQMIAEKFNACLK